MTTYTATYSPEDNKIRLYASTRLDADTYAMIKEAGFQWAPKQELFVAPKWTPRREDVALQLAGEIEPEESTIAERAAIKAERLDMLAGKKLAQAGAYQRAAESLSEAFYMGQPILVGHHSERKARKTKERMDSAQNKAIRLTETSNYWLYRATGVEHFANMKNDPRVRANRIKTLLAELRDVQRTINKAHHNLASWEKATTDEQITNLIGNSNIAPTGMYYDLRNGVITPQQARERCLAGAKSTIESDYLRRWIDHILNRLSFEREMLGDVARFEGDLTPVILQAFAREHGAEQPKCTIVDDGYFLIESAVPLPMHIGAGRTYLELADDEWRDLMHSTGYEVPAPKVRRASSAPAPVVLINPTIEEAEQLQRIWNLQMAAACRKSRATPEENKVRSITQARYSANSKGDYAPLTTMEIDANGRRVEMHWEKMERVKSGEPVARIRVYTGGSGFYMPRAVVHISDKPTKALPIDLDAIEAAAKEAAAEPVEQAA